jgi:hypothetical protein
MMINKKYKLTNTNNTSNNELPINTNIINTNVKNNASSSQEPINVPIPFHDDYSHEAPYDNSISISYNDVDETPFIYNKKINNQVENVENDVIYAEY